MTEDLKKIHSYLPTLVDQMETGRVDRREFLRISTLLGLSSAAAYALTGLAEYRNGGLMVDLGLIVPRDPGLPSERGMDARRERMRHRVPEHRMQGFHRRAPVAARGRVSAPRAASGPRPARNRSARHRHRRA